MQEANLVAQGLERPGQVITLSLTERLEAERHQLERRLKQVNEALDALHANPEAQKLFDAVTKLGHFGY